MTSDDVRQRSRGAAVNPASPPQAQRGCQDPAGREAAAYIAEMLVELRKMAIAADMAAAAAAIDAAYYQVHRALDRLHLKPRPVPAERE
jgi:hypothetical protein